MDLGTLVGYLSLDTKEWDKGLADGDSKLKKFGGMAAAGAAAAGAAIGAALVVGITEAIQTEQADDKLAAQLGATGEYAEELGTIAGNLYSNAYGESLEQVNEALRGVMQQGVVMEDASAAQIEAVTAKVLDLATAFDQDLGAATGAVGQMIRTGMAVDADQALDILTRGMQQGADRAGDLLDTFTEYPALFESLGLEGTEAMGLISQGMRDGARNADLVADALKEFQIRATDGSKTSADAFRAMGLDAEEMTAKIARGGPEAKAGLDAVLDGLRNMEDPVARNAAAVGLFGTQAEDLAGALFALDPSEAVADMGKVAGAATETGNTLNDNLGTRLETLKRTLMTAFVETIEQHVIPALDRFVVWVQTNLGPAFDQLKTGWDTLTGAFSGGAGSTEGSMGRVVGAVQGMVDSVGPAMDTLKSIFQSAVDIVTALWEMFGDNILNYLAGTLENLMGAVRGALNIIKGIFDVFAGILTGDWRRVWDGIKSIFTGAWQVITAAFSQIVNTITTIAKNIWTAITSAFSGLGSALYDVGRDMIQGLLNGAGSLLRNIGRFFLNLLPSWIRGPFEQALGIASPSKVFYGYGQNLGQGLVDGITATRGLVGAAVGELVPAGAGSLALGAVGGGTSALGGYGAGAPRVVIQHDTIVQTTGDPNRIAAAIDARNRDREFLAGVA